MPVGYRSRIAINPGSRRASPYRSSRLSHPRVYNLAVSRMDAYGNPQREIPSRIVLLRYRAGDPSSEQLFLDQMPVPRDAWDYDVADRILTWRGAYGGGRLHMTHDGRGATGVIGSLGDLCSVRAGSRTIFDCDVALDIGASYESVGTRVRGLLWDPASPTWKNANWAENEKRLRLTYTYTPGSGMDPPSFTFEFEDNVTKACPWGPDEGTFIPSLTLTTQNGSMVWSLVFTSQLPPNNDSRPNPSPKTGPDSVYPYWMQAVEDATVTSINGVLVIDEPAPHGMLVGMQGVAPDCASSGYYRISAEAAPFGVFDGRMTVGGRAVPRSRLLGSVLHWQDLTPEYQQRTGLPERGSLSLQPEGSAVGDRLGIRAARLDAATALASIAQHRDFHPELHVRVASMQEALSAQSLNIQGLLAMNPFVQDAHGAWGDAVQAVVRQDLSDIMNSCIPSDMWGLLFPKAPQPTLSGELATVANSPVTGVSDPKSFYRSLAAAVMTQGMANGSDANCRNLNGPRAAAWLKTQLATSAVYSAHGQQLFQYEWQNKFTLTQSYLDDQKDNASNYETAIKDEVAKQIGDINTNVVNDPSTPNLKADLIAQVSNAGNYAKDKHLYWAFHYYTWNTKPGFLNNIALQMSYNTGSADATTLSRLLQQNAAVLTALDPSGFFARQYANTINTFLVTNVLPSMFDFTGDASSFDLIKQYLQQFCDINLKNQDSQTADAASQIQAILDAENADNILHLSIDALRDFAEAIQEALALPFIAEKFVGWFKDTFPRFASASEIFGSVLIGGITGLAVFDLISEFKDLNSLNDEQKTQLGFNTAQLALEILAAVVKRGVRIGALFGVDGLTTAQRTAAVSKIITTGESDFLDFGLPKIGSSFARWLGDTKGTVGLFSDFSDAPWGWDIFTRMSDTAAEEGSLATRVFGASLDEFVATRLGPLFILSGIGFSLYSIIEGEASIPLANDILNIVGGPMMLLAMAGEWAIEEGIIAADGVMATIFSAAGPLAILAALAGIGLMIYEMFQQPPDPVQEFVDNYARPAGFAVAGQSASIDYAAPYSNPDQSGLMMVGFSLSANGKYLLANSDGSIGAGAATVLPDCVWQSQTDGLGLSRIVTVIQPDPTKLPVAVWLSLISDRSGNLSVSFQPKASPPMPPSTPFGPVVDGPKIVTQTWLSAPAGNPKLTSKGGFLDSIPLTFRPVLPDGNGNHAPSQASGWLMLTDKGLAISQTAGTTFTLQMSAMAPNYMRMADLSFLQGSTPDPTQTYGPAFGVPPSTPMTYSLKEELPAFLTFSTQTGAVTPNGGTTPSSAYQSTNSITAENTFLKKPTDTADFTIAVTPLSTPPSPPANVAAAEAQRA
jgi:hypothetical protein